MSQSTLHLQLRATTERDALTRMVKALAATHGLSISAITSADAFPELAEHLDRHIAAGRMSGLDWFTPERARFSSRPRNLQETARSILSVGVAYWAEDDGKPDDGVPRGTNLALCSWGRLSRSAEGSHAPSPRRD